MQPLWFNLGGKLWSELLGMGSIIIETTVMIVRVKIAVRSDVDDHELLITQ